MRRLQASCSDARGSAAYRQQAGPLEACRAGLGQCRHSSTTSLKALKSRDVPLLDLQQHNVANLSSLVHSRSKQQLVQQQLLSWPAGRRALLAGVGLSPLLDFLSPADAQAAEPSDSSSSSVGTGSASEPGPSQQQGAESADAAGQAADSTGGTAGQAERDDSPSQIFDDDDSSSSSSSDSSSDSDSESSSDEEPGELFASSDDNNVAGGSSSDGGSAGSNGSTSTADSSSQASSSSDAASTANSKSATRTTMGSNLSVPRYIQILQDSRRSSWPLLAQKIQTSEWIELSQLLVQAPFDAVRQACFYIPWALLQCDDFEAAIAARKAYLDYIDHVHALAGIALKAADGVPGADVQVQQAFTLMNASLNAFLAAVPVKYQRYRI